MTKNRYTDEEFEEIINKYYAMAYNMCKKYVKSHYMIEDILSISFEKLYRSLDKNKTEAETQSYIMKTVKNTMKNYIKSEARRTDSLELLDNFRYKNSLDGDPLYKMLKDEEVEILKEGIASLNPKISQTFMMIYDGYSIKEIAIAMDVPVKTVYSRERVGKQQLREFMENYHQSYEEGGKHK